MPGPLEHAGVEDVLSSIRRLVSEDKRNARPSILRGQGSARPRLVLTPALRVSPPTAEASSESDHEDDQAAPALRDASELVQSDDVTVQKLHEDDEQRAGENVPEAQSPTDTAELSQNFLNHTDASDVVALHKDQPLSDVVDGGHEGTDDPIVTPPWKRPETTLYRAAEELRSASAFSAMTLDEEGHRDAPLVDRLSSKDPVLHSVAPAGSSAELLNASARQRAAAVVRKIAEMEAASGRTSSGDDWEPDAREEGPFASEASQGAAHDWQDADPVEEERSHDSYAQHLLNGSMTEVIDAAVEAVEDRIADAGLADVEGSSDAALLDEETLREMVVDIVRTELQGALGEKITRNVRKLVRREIQRAFASHDLL